MAIPIGYLEVKKIISATAGEKGNLRDRMFFSLLFGCALRTNELLKLKVDDVVFGDENYIIAHRSKLRTTRKQKGNKGGRPKKIKPRNPTKMLPLPPDIILSLKDFVAVRRKESGKNAVLFQSPFRHRDALSLQNLEYLIKKYTRLAGVQQNKIATYMRKGKEINISRVTLHTFRHSLARLIMEITHDPELKRYMLGHAPRDQTEIYGMYDFMMANEKMNEFWKEVRNKYGE